MELFVTILNDLLTSLYQSFWFSLLLAFMLTFFYLYCYQPQEAGKGMKAAIKAWARKFKTSAFFRRLLMFCLFLVMTLFRTLLNRKIWSNPISNVLGVWGIWSVSSTGVVSLTIENVENVMLTVPLIFMALLTFGEKLVKRQSVGAYAAAAAKISFLFSAVIELLQLLLRLGTFQLSDLFYNTVGGLLGGLLAYAYTRRKERKARKNLENNRAE